MSARRHASLATLVLLGGLLALAGPIGVRAQDQDDERDAATLLRAELAALRREVKDLKRRVSDLEEQVRALRGPASTADGKAEISSELGFVLPGVSRTAGAESPSELARQLHAAVRKGEALEALVAFEGERFLVPEALFSPAARVLKGLVGLPTRSELERAFAALRRGNASTLSGRITVEDAVPPASKGLFQVVELTVMGDERSERYRLTAVRVRGRWLAAYLLDLTAEDDALTFLQDLYESQRSYRAYHMGSYAKSLHQLAGEQKVLESSGSLQAAGLTFPLGARLDRLERDDLKWQGEELRGPFYAFRLTGDEVGSSWSALALPHSPSYQTFHVALTPGSKPGVRPPIRAARGPLPEAWANGKIEKDE